MAILVTTVSDLRIDSSAALASGGPDGPPSRRDLIGKTRLGTTLVIDGIGEALTDLQTTWGSTG
jgi:hypothetical protein